MSICKPSLLPSNFWVCWLISMLIDTKITIPKIRHYVFQGTGKRVEVFNKAFSKRKTQSWPFKCDYIPGINMWFINVSWKEHGMTWSQPSMRQKSMENPPISGFSDWKFKIYSNANFLPEFNFESTNVIEHSGSTSKIGLPSSGFYVTPLKNQIGICFLLILIVE